MKAHEQTPRTPPRLACWLLRLRLSRAHYECIAGDLLEDYAHGGRTRAWFWRQALSALPGRFHAIDFETERKGFEPMMLISDLWQDIRYAARTLGKNPSFAIVSVLALAFGIGVNTAIFSVLNSVALRPLPVADSGQVISMYQTFRGKASRFVNGSESYFSYYEYKKYRDDNASLSGLAAYATVRASIGGPSPKRVEGQIVSCNFFEVLGRAPAIGRGFSANECDVPGANPVVVLSHNLWKSVFRADPKMVGSTLTLNREAFTVIGIAPEGFTGVGVEQSQFRAPVTMQARLIPGMKLLEEDNTSWLEMLGRLKPGTSLSKARADLGVIAARIDQLYPGRTTSLSISTATLLGDPEARTVVIAGGAVALGAVGMVLLIACANVANLLLARAAGRQKEIAIRLSAGASRLRLVRQLLTESLLIALAGGALGSVFTFWTSDALMQLLFAQLPADAPRLTLDLAPDIRVLSFALGMSILTAALFGLLPALQATRPDLIAALKEEGSGFAGASVSRGWLRSALVAAQVSVCLVLLIASGLLARGLQSAQSVDPGYSLQGVVIASFDLRQQGYDGGRAKEFHRQLMERVLAIPGVDSVSQTAIAPLEGSNQSEPVQIAGIERPQSLMFNQTSAGFFQTVALPILRGRSYTKAEVDREADVAVLSESTARRFWPNQDPLGKQFVFEGRKTMVEVIGIVPDARMTNLTRTDAAYAYLPPKRGAQTGLHLVVHTSGNLQSAAKSIREAAHTLDSNVIANAKPLADNLELWRAPSRILASLTGVLGLAGLLLASIGIYGVVSYAVSQRIREIGIRMTLGAEPAGILRMVLKQAMRPVAIGLAIGFAVCAAASQLMSSVLYGVSPLDPLTFGGVAMFLSGVALLACYLPARRATRVDPMDALRYE